MAEETRIKRGRLSERVRRADALEEAKRAELEIYRHVVGRLGEFEELQGFYSGIPLEEVRKQLTVQHAEALEAVESDRATFQEAVAEWFEAKWRVRQVAQGALVVFFAFVVGGLFLLTLLDATALLPRQPANFLLGLIGAMFASSINGRGSRLVDALRTRRYARRDLYAAESLLERAIREVALPSQLRQIGRGAAAGGTLREPAVEAEPRAKPPLPDSVLAPIDPRHLVELSGSPQQLSTAGRKRLKSLVDVLGSASLGIAGPRGVGKTSLLEWFFDHQFNEFGHLSVRVPAPVRYEPRDFVLSAFAQVCETVLGAQESSGFPTRSRPFASITAFVLGTAALVAGIALLATDMSLGGSDRDQAGVGLIAFGFFLLFLRLLPSAREGIAFHKLSRSVIRDKENPEEIASQLLTEISFQLTFATGYSGKLTTGPGELATETSYSLASRQESFPDVVARFRAFLEAVARQRNKLYIGIDELDKMEVDAAVRFLDDIKGLFGIPNCFFLVCISEDALGQFERRGLPIRDAFDSAFDEVIRIEPLQAGESIALLNKRTEMDDGLAAVCHILAGGLPRDVIRYARRLAVLSRSPITIEAAVTELLHQDLRERTRGMKLATEDEAAATDEGLRELDSSKQPIDADRLTEIAASLPDSLAPLSCLTLFSATILQLTALDRGQLSTVLRDADRLAAIRLDIPENPAHAWTACLELRERHGLPDVAVAA